MQIQCFGETIWNSVKLLPFSQTEGYESICNKKGQLLFNF